MNRVIGGGLAICGLFGSSCVSAQACEGDVAQWSREFIALRAVRGHFDGGTWSAAVDGWGGRKHQLMQCLGAQAGRSTPTGEVLAQWLGEPDTRWTCPSRECNEVARLTESAVPLPGPSQLWVYRWRGEHDRLAFTLVDGRVRRVDWAFAHE